MKKSDLKTGMVVESRDKRTYIVFKDTPIGDILTGFVGFKSLSNYNENLTEIEFKNLDIMKVYEPTLEGSLNTFFITKTLSKYFNLIWERKDDSKEVAALKLDVDKVKKTLKDIEDKLTKMESER